MPEAAILAGGSGSTTFESLAGVADLLARRSGLDRVLLVSDPYHALRTRLMRQELGLDRLRLTDADEPGRRVRGRSAGS